MKHEATPDDFFLQESETIEVPEGWGEEIRAGLRGDLIDYPYWANREGWTPSEMVSLFWNRVLPPEADRSRQDSLFVLQNHHESVVRKLAGLIEEARRTGTLGARPAKGQEDFDLPIRPIDALLFVEKYCEVLNEAEDENDSKLRDLTDADIEEAEVRLRDRSLTSAERVEAKMVLKRLRETRASLGNTSERRLYIKPKLKELVLKAVRGPDQPLIEDVKAEVSRKDRLSAAGRKGSVKRWGTGDEKSRREQKYRDEALCQLCRQPAVSYPALIRTLSRIFSVSDRTMRRYVTRKWLLSKGYCQAEPPANS